MKNILIAFGLILSFGSYGQDTTINRTISLQDSILLRNFWTAFTSAIQNSDKNQLADLLEFPLYCRPCIDEKTVKTSDEVTAKVTKQGFYKSQYKAFFAKPIKDVVEKHQQFETHLFHPSSYNQNKPDEFAFSYTIVAPSKTWEGSQGFVYLRKKGGKLKITSIDIIP